MAQVALGPLFAAAEAELKALKTISENIVEYFCPKHSNAKQPAPELMDALSTRSREIIQKNMLKASSLTLAILKSLYPRADLEAAGEGFATTSSDEEGKALVISFLDSRQDCRNDPTCPLVTEHTTLYFVHDIVYKQLSAMLL
jgi:hypothetical protein